MYLYYIAAALALLALIVLGIAYYCYRRVFYAAPRRPLGEEEFEMPPGKIYEAYREPMIRWMKMTRDLPHEEVEITSHDGLVLRGKYYEHKKGAPLELLFHGYRGNAERDMCAGVERCFAIGRNALIVNQRAAGTSEGHVITFGIKEHRDCLDWINFAIARFGNEQKIILTGVSMGAATVMMAAGTDLPPNVVCVLADCGYSSAREIIQKIVRELGLPVPLVYPFIKLGARVFGHFSLEETSPMEAMRRARVPVIFIHGDTDDFVPHTMSEALFKACTSQKKLVLVKGAGHALAFPVDKEGYLQALRDFQTECGF